MLNRSTKTSYNKSKNNVDINGTMARINKVIIILVIRIATLIIGIIRIRIEILIIILVTKKMDMSLGLKVGVELTRAYA